MGKRRGCRRRRLQAAARRGLAAAGDGGGEARAAGHGGITAAGAEGLPERGGSGGGASPASEEEVGRGEEGAGRRHGPREPATGLPGLAAGMWAHAHMAGDDGTWGRRQTRPTGADVSGRRGSED